MQEGEGVRGQGSGERGAGRVGGEGVWVQAGAALQVQAGPARWPGVGGGLEAGIGGLGQTASASNRAVGQGLEKAGRKGG